MARSERPQERPSTQRWVGAALIGIGAIFVVAALVMFVAGEPSGGSDYRAISRALIVGAALGAYGVYRTARSDKGAGTPGSAPGPGRASGSADLAGMLLHSDDLAATLRDVAAHGSKGGFGATAELLERAGVMGWRNAPKNMRASRLSRNGRWWLRVPPTFDEKDYDLLVGIEAALNVGSDIEAGKGASAREVLELTASIEPNDYHGEFAVERTLDGAKEGGEWWLRVKTADFVENCPLPFRCAFDLQANAATGTVCVDVECPRPGCFALVGPGGSTPVDEARAYALRLALLVARGAIGCAGARRAVVNCLERDGEGALLSIDVTEPSLERLVAAASEPGLATGALPTDPALRASVRPDGWLALTEPFLRRDDQALCPAERFRELELVDAPCPRGLARACGARRMSDLGINEKAGRVSAWNSLVADLGETTQDAVSKLVDLRDATDDVTVAEACDRTSKALVDGTLDVSDKHKLALLFVDGSALAAATRRASEALAAETPTADALRSALEGLEAALSPITEMGAYLDDSASVYRYFNSVAERVRYNLTADDGGREVRLVPDEYYAAHSTAARILNMLERGEEAMAHATEARRIAPVTTDATLGMVRCLEEQSRIFEAADLLKETIASAITVRDMAICFYRLAYMEWKLGRGDLAIACYQRSMQLSFEIARQARSELEDLVSADDELSELPEDQVVPTLEAAGIPTGDVEAIRKPALAAAVACADAGAFSAARPLTGVLIEITSDDVLIDVQRSLSQP